ncbi:MAG: type II toxin-antitoxin system RelE/ParE family toxin [Gammaproteobacteria bacterium]|nr:type II toxin-antitoxin system RelE/ParE family toxin [Gammaproteobacteria bacterium]
MYHIKFKTSVEKDLRRMGIQEQARILEGIEKKLAEDPRQGTPLKGKKQNALWRYHIGNYRVVYAFNDQELWILVIHIAHRKDVYRSL